jgi:S1-C subfamily serine protease/Flp pilus assembly protein TadD
LKALDRLKQQGWAEADNPEEERTLADLAAAGFTRKEGGDAYVYTANRDREQRNPAIEKGTEPEIEAVKAPSFGNRAGTKRQIIAACAGFALVAGIIGVIVLKHGGEAEQRPPASLDSAPVQAPGPHNALSAEALYALASPGVVTISTKNDDGENIGIGSGFFVNEELVHERDDSHNRWFADWVSKKEGRKVQFAYLVTNYHVIRPAVRADIALADGIKGSVHKVITEDEATDLALLEVLVFSAKSSTQLPLGDETPRVGAAVYAIGNPQGLANSLSAGIVSGVREIKAGLSWLQTTSPISPGSSGGPLLTPDGKVVGVTTAIRRGGQNLNFAVPVSELRRFLAASYRKRALEEGRSIRCQEREAFIQLPFGKDDFTSILLKAHDYIANKKHDEAIAALEGVSSSVPPEFRYLYYFLLGKAHYSLAADEVFHTEHRRSSTVREVRAAFRDNLHGCSALASLQQAQRLKPTFEPTYELLYRYHEGAGQPEEALLAADSLVKLMPHCADAYYMRGECFSELDKDEHALADLQEALRLNPRDRYGHYVMARVWNGLQEYDKAIDSFKTALSLKYDPWACHWGIGNAYQRAGKYEQAILAYEKSIAAGGPRDWCKERIAICRRLGGAD